MTYDLLLPRRIVFGWGPTHGAAAVGRNTRTASPPRQRLANPLREWHPRGPQGFPDRGGADGPLRPRRRSTASRKSKTSMPRSLASGRPVSSRGLRPRGWGAARRSTSARSGGGPHATNRQSETSRLSGRSRPRPQAGPAAPPLSSRCRRRRGPAARGRLEASVISGQAEGFKKSLRAGRTWSLQVVLVDPEPDRLRPPQRVTRPGRGSMRSRSSSRATSPGTPVRLPAVPSPRRSPEGDPRPPPA